MLKILIDPDTFFREHDDVNIFIAVLLVVISAILGIVMLYANLDIIESTMIKQLQQTLPAEQARLMFEAMKYNLLLSPLISSFVGWVIIAGLIHAVSSVFGGVGDFVKTLKLTAFGYIPSIVLFPVSFSIVRMTHELMNTPIMIVSISSTIWQFIILTFGIKNWRRLDTTKAAASVAIPLVILTGLGIIGRLLRPT